MIRFCAKIVGRSLSQIANIFANCMGETIHTVMTMIPGLRTSHCCI
jgi:hypothetical protein